MKIKTRFVLKRRQVYLRSGLSFCKLTLHYNPLLLQNVFDGPYLSQEAALKLMVKILFLLN